MSEEQVTEQNQKLSEQDRLVLEMAKLNKKLAIANAEKAISQNETADIHYKYVVLQVYMKYGLSNDDAIDDQYNIIKGGAKTNQ